MEKMNGNPPAPCERKKPPLWTRFVDIALRTVHVLGISLLSGGAVFGATPDQLAPVRHLVLFTGSALIVSEWLHRPHWPTQVRGLMVYLHAGLFALTLVWPALAAIWLFLALAFGMFGSHLPKRIRHWSFVLRRSEE
jgi:hypothetical protein